MITHIKGANHYWCLRVARLGGDLACQPVAPIKAYASQSVRAGGHGHAQGLRRCSWAGVRRAITAKVRSTGCGLTSAWPSAPGKHAPRSLQLPLGLPDGISVRPREKSLTLSRFAFSQGLSQGSRLSALALHPRGRPRPPSPTKVLRTAPVAPAHCNSAPILPVRLPPPPTSNSHPQLTVCTDPPFALSLAAGWSMFVEKSSTYPGGNQR